MARPSLSSTRRCGNNAEAQLLLMSAEISRFVRVCCIWKPQAKTTKKITIRLECKECKTKKQLVLKRTKHFELGEKKGKGTGY